VVLAGNGHLAHGSGIPQRLQRRVPTASAIVLQGDSVDLESQGADYLLVSRDIGLPASGRLGVMLEESANGMRVQSVIAESGSQKAGIRLGDRIVGIEDNGIESMEEIRLALWDKNPGEVIQVSVARDDQDGDAQELTLDIVLQQ
jgi:S1-C subfamily serine protease